MTPAKVIAKGTDALKFVKRASDGHTLFMWRAWSANRERICDCGTAWAEDDDGARSIAYMTIGGPRRHLVDEVDVEPVIEGVQ